jgi:hypothetical protein
VEKQSDVRNYGEVNVGSPEGAKSFMQSALGGREKDRHPYEKQWFTNIAMCLGYQWLRWDSRSNRMQPPRDSRKPRIVGNIMSGIVQTCKARMLKQDPKVTVRPATSDDEDIEIAKISTRVQQAYDKKIGIKTLRDEFFDWLFMTGNAFYKVSWDSKAGAPLMFTPDMLAMPGEDGNDEALNLLSAQDEFKAIAGDMSMTAYTGEPRVEALGPFNVLWEPTLKFKDSPWVLVTKLRSKTYVRDKYPKFADQMDVSPETGGYSAWFERGLLSLQGDHAGAETNSNNGSVIVHELYTKPDSRNPNGIVAVMVGQLLVEHGENPYRCIPLAYCGDITVAGRPIATSRIEQVIPLQVDINKTLSQIVENRNKTVSPKLGIPIGGGTTQADFTDGTGEIFEFHADQYGNRPEYLQAPTLPQYVFEHLNTLYRFVDDITGIHDVSNSRAPTSGASGYLVDLLLEQDETRFGPLALRVAECEKEMRTILHKILRMYITEDRLLTIVGKNQAFDTEMWFNGNMLVGSKETDPNVDYYDIDVDFQPSLSNSKPAIKEAIFQLINQGFFNPQNPMDKQLVMMHLNLDARDADFFDDIEQDRSKAMDENRRLKTGEPVPVAPYENHAIEYFVHNKMRKSPEFGTLHPMIQQMVHEHCSMHEYYLQQLGYMIPQPPQPPAPAPMPGAQPQMGMQPPTMGQGMNPMPPEMAMQGAPMTNGVNGVGTNRLALLNGGA